MAQHNEPGLVDILTRHQIYVERFKLGFGVAFDNMMLELRRELRIVFSEVEYDKLNGMTKRDLDQFVKRLVKLQQRHFDSYTQLVLQQIEAFMKADVEMQATIMEETQAKNKKAAIAIAALLARKSLNDMWARYKVTAIPANGAMPTAFLERFGEASSIAFEQLIRKAAVNGMTTKETLALFIGSSRANYRDGLMVKLGYQNNAMTATLVQHAASMAAVAVHSRYFKQYVWVSVLDNGTTIICRERNGKIYFYADGPLPPAHVGCRSKAVPLAPGAQRDAAQSYAEWFAAQPDVVKKDIGGDGKEFIAKGPLTLEQFKGKLSIILAA